MDDSEEQNEQDVVPSTLPEEVQDVLKVCNVCVSSLALHVAAFETNRWYL